MILFVTCICFLWILSFSFQETTTFKREKVAPLKAIMAVLIVMHHLSFNVNGWGIPVFHSWGAPIVSVFFFISGYGLIISVKKKNYLSIFIKSRIWNSLVLPFLLALVIYKIVQGNIFTIPSLINMIKHGYTTLPNSWYVFVILFLYLGFYCSCKIAQGKYLIPALFLICICYTMATVYLGYARCWYISVFAFPLGAVYGKYEKTFHYFWNKKLIYYSTIPLCLFLIGILYLLHNEVAYMMVYILIPLMIINLCLRLRIEYLNRFKIIGWLSGISYEIYLCQGIAFELARGKYMWIESELLYVFCSFALTFLFAKLVKAMKSRLALL